MKSFFSNRPSASPYSSMSDTELYGCFERNNWVNTEESQRLALLQEVADRQAAADGNTYKITVHFDDMASHTSGYQSGTHIYLNRDMYVHDINKGIYNGREITYYSTDSNWNALETVLHESRHVHQDMVAKGTVNASPEEVERCASNGFTVSDVDGQRGCQYMKGETSYNLYFLNPTELDSFKTSQDKVRSVIAEQKSLGMTDASADEYLSALDKKGYEVTLNDCRNEYQCYDVDKQVEQVLKNEYYNTNVPVDSNIEQAVKNEMIVTQQHLDNQRLEKSDMAKEVHEANGYTFTEYDNGTVTAEGKIPEAKNTEPRQNMPTPDGMDATTDRGHLIAHMHNGPDKEAFNISAQDSGLNRGTMKSVENAESRLAAEGNDVHTSKTAYVSHEGSKPDAYMVNDTITTPDGETQHVHLSFQNMSKSEQEAMNQQVAEMDIPDGYDNPDPARESMSTEEYNQLMEKTEGELSSVRNEYDMSSHTERSFSFDQESVDAAVASYEANAQSEASASADVSASTDSGVSSDSGSGVDSGSSGGADAGCGVGD